MQSEKTANGAVFSDCTNSKFKICQMLLFQHHTVMQKDLPVGLSLIQTLETWS